MQSQAPSQRAFAGTNIARYLLEDLKAQKASKRRQFAAAGDSTFLTTDGDVDLYGSNSAGHGHDRLPPISKTSLGGTHGGSSGLGRAHRS